jgi:hypothetical protein
VTGPKKNKRISTAIASPQEPSPEERADKIADLERLKQKKSLTQKRAATELRCSELSVRRLVDDSRLRRSEKGRIIVDDRFVEECQRSHGPSPEEREKVELSALMLGAGNFINLREGARIFELERKPVPPMSIAEQKPAEPAQAPEASAPGGEAPGPRAENNAKTMSAGLPAEAVDADRFPGLGWGQDIDRSNSPIQPIRSSRDRSPSIMREEKFPRKGDPLLLGAGELVNFSIAENYAGITARQRQKLMKRGLLESKGLGHNRKITTESLRKYLPPQENQK